MMMMREERSQSTFTLESNRTEKTSFLSLKANKNLFNQLQIALNSTESNDSESSHDANGPSIMFMSPTAAKIVIGSTEFYLNVSLVHDADVYFKPPSSAASLVFKGGVDHRLRVTRTNVAPTLQNIARGSEKRKHHITQLEEIPIQPLPVESTENSGVAATSSHANASPPAIKRSRTKSKINEEQEEVGEAMVLLRNVPCQFSVKDIAESVFKDLTCSGYLLSPTEDIGTTEDCLDVYVVFSSPSGAKLAVGRSGEYIYSAGDRSTPKYKSEIESVDLIECIVAEMIGWYTDLNSNIRIEQLLLQMKLAMPGILLSHHHPRNLAKRWQKILLRIGKNNRSEIQCLQKDIPVALQERYSTSGIRLSISRDKEYMFENPFAQYSLEMSTMRTSSCRAADGQTAADVYADCAEFELDDNRLYCEKTDLAFQIFRKDLEEVERMKELFEEKLDLLQLRLYSSSNSSEGNDSVLIESYRGIQRTVSFYQLLYQEIWALSRTYIALPGVS